MPLAELLARRRGAARALRRTQRQMEREACTFEIVPADAVPPLLPELAAVSDAWLAEKHTREKGFSLGFFDRTYSRGSRSRWCGSGARSSRSPTSGPAAPRRSSRSTSCATADRAPGRDGLPLHRADAVGQGRGLRWFSLGMAPLSGLERRTLAPLWIQRRRASSSATASTSTTSRACASTRRSSIRSGSRATSPRPAGSRCRACSRTSRRSSAAGLGAWSASSRSAGQRRRAVSSTRSAAAVPAPPEMRWPPSRVTTLASDGGSDEQSECFSPVPITQSRGKTAELLELGKDRHRIVMRDLGDDVLDVKLEARALLEAQQRDQVDPAAEVLGKARGHERCDVRAVGVPDQDDSALVPRAEVVPQQPGEVSSPTSSGVRLIRR